MNLAPSILFTIRVYQETQGTFNLSSSEFNEGVGKVQRCGEGVGKPTVGCEAPGLVTGKPGPGHLEGEPRGGATGQELELVWRDTASPCPCRSTGSTAGD